MADIIVTYTSIDGARTLRRFSDLQAAQKFAHQWVGERPSLGHSYAVSDDGIGKITVSGVSLRDLFPEGF